MNKIRILIMEDVEVIREGITTILSLQPDLQVVGEAQDGLQAVQIALETKPHIILLDLDKLDRVGIITTISILKETLPDSQILVLTGFAKAVPLDHFQLFKNRESPERLTCSPITRNKPLMVLRSSHSISPSSTITKYFHWRLLKQERKSSAN